MTMNKTDVKRIDIWTTRGSDYVTCYIELAHERMTTYLDKKRELEYSRGIVSWNEGTMTVAIMGWSFPMTQSKTGKIHHIAYYDREDPWGNTQSYQGDYVGHYAGSYTEPLESE